MKTKLILKRINIFCSLVVIFLCLITIIHISFLVGQYYFLLKTEKEIRRLGRENQFLEDEFLKISTLSNLDEFLKERNFVKAKNFKYLQVFGSAAIAK